MKIRIYKNKTGQVERVERDSAHAEDGAYSDDFHPYVYLKDRNDPSKGYENVPEWFVIDDSDLPKCRICHMNVVDGKVVEDVAKRELEDLEKASVKDKYQAALSKVEDPDLKELITKLAESRKLI